MLREIGRMARRPVFGEIRGRAAQHAPVRGELARDQRRILQRAEADRDVVAVVDEVDDLVGEPQVQRHGRVAAQERGNHGRDVLAAERRRHRHFQPSIRLAAAVADRRPRGVGGRQQRLGPGHEDFAVLRETDAAGGAVQQSRAELAFELRDARAGDRGRHAELAPGRRHVREQRGAHEQADVEQVERLVGGRNRIGAHCSEIPENVSGNIAVFSKDRAAYDGMHGAAPRPADFPEGVS